MLPQMVGFGNYFLQTSLGTILSQLHDKQQNQKFSDNKLDEINGEKYNSFSQQRKIAQSPTKIVLESEAIDTDSTRGEKDSPALSFPLLYLPEEKKASELDTVRLLLETVNTTVTKQLLEANVKKLSMSPTTVISHDVDEAYQVILLIIFL